MEIFHKTTSNLTPTTNSGVGAVKSSIKNSGLAFRIDWFQGTFPTIHLNRVKKYLCDYIGFGKFEERMTGISFFDKSAVHPSGAVLGMGRKKGKGKIDHGLCFLQLSATVISYGDPLKMYNLMVKLHHHIPSLKCTRLDLAVDDFDKKISIQEVKEAVDNHHYIGFHDCVRYIESGRAGSKGKTVSFGKRGSNGSGKYLTFYEKFLESKGKIDSIRVELALYKYSAVQCFEQLVSSSFDSWKSIFLGWISGAVDFRERQGDDDKNPGRRDRLSFWDDFISGFDKIKPVFNYPPKLIDDVKEFLLYIAPTISTVFRSFSRPSDFDLWFGELLEHGFSRMSERHFHILANSS